MLFPTTIAGSLPKPEWLAEPNTLLGTLEIEAATSLPAPASTPPCWR